MSEYVLEVRNITKRFPGVLANDNINLKLKKGEILAILGENGAGKSTLMNIIYGLYDPDEGQIFLDGKEVKIANPHDAIARGIGMVHQHFMLVPVFTALENIVLGSETTKGLSLDLKSARKEVLKISEQYGLPIDPDMLIEDMPVGLQQRVEIIKALYRRADILVLDEPTAVLTPQEADDLFKVMRSLTEQGKSIIFITHKLREVLDVSDDITVIRNGKVVGSTKPAEANSATLASMMVGREVVLQVEKSEKEAGETILEVENLQVSDERDHLAVKDVSFTVRQGEILGIAGVQGNGQTELVEALTGLRTVKGGQILIDGKDATNATPRKITEMGCAHIPEDRQRDGLVLEYSIADNMVLNTYYLEPFARGGIIQETPILEQAKELVKNFDVRTPSPVTSAGSLSGGNQQKVIVAREFSRPVKFLLAAQPTRGLDVGSIEYIHKRLIQKRDEGTAVLLVSTELDEIMQLSDRIAVMYAGQIVDILDASKVTKEIVGLLMAGEKPHDSWEPQFYEKTKIVVSQMELVHWHLTNMNNDNLREIYQAQKGSDLITIQVPNVPVEVYTEGAIGMQTLDNAYKEIQVPKDLLKWAIDLTSHMDAGTSSNNPNDSLNFWQKAYEMAPGHPIILMSLAVQYGELGQREMALKYIHQAHDLAPKHSRVTKNYQAILEHFS